MRHLNWPTRLQGAAKRNGCGINPDEQFFAGLFAMNLTSEQKSAVKQIREKFGEKLPSSRNSDADILKWLIARDFDVAQAEEMLRKHLEWRKEWEVDSILSWKPPEVMIKYYPVGHSGVDKEGSPVWMIPIGRGDLRGMLHSCSKRDYVRYTIQILEKSMEDMKAKSRGLDVPINRLTCIFDLDCFSIWQVTWKPGMDVILQLVQMYEANYPELLKSAFVINAPRVFTTVYALIKPFLNDVTLGKIKIFGKNGWQEALLKDIPADQLPAHWGGTMCDPDGDTKCSSKICMGGEVPKSYYLKNRMENSNSRKKDYQESLVLPKSGKETIEMEVIHPGTELRWEFQSDDFDVGFGISYKSSTGEDVVLLSPQRVNSHLVPEEGSIVCSDPGKYKITFDNEYSYIRSKKLNYTLQMFPPTEHTKL